MMSTEDRVSYNEIQEWYFGAAYSYCRHKIARKSPWTGDETEYGFAYAQLDNSFDLAIEKLMLEVIYLISTAGRVTQEVQSAHREIMEALLSSNTGEELFSNLSSDEVSEIRSHLNLLGYEVGG
jgi:hypothetical protein